MKKQRWMAAGTVAVVLLAGLGAAYACWIMLPALWADEHSKKPLMTFLAVFVVAFAILVLGSRLIRKRRP